MIKYRHEALKIQSTIEFEKQALRTFRFQYHNIPVYSQFVDLLGIHPSEVNSIEKIPFLPISVFKTHEVLVKGGVSEINFKSSGTVSYTHLTLPTIYSV